MRAKLLSTELDPKTTRLHLVGEGAHLTWAELITAWEDPEFAVGFSSALATLPHVAYRWECPALTSSCLEDRGLAEFVVVDDPRLDRATDRAAFAEHLNEAPVATFSNLGLDATLVVPSELAPSADYTHLASFLRTAPKRQHVALWDSVARALRARLGEVPVWLSTAGGSVAWLHVRLDDRPKYYAHSPYRATPRT